MPVMPQPSTQVYGSDILKSVTLGSKHDVVLSSSVEK